MQHTCDDKTWNKKKSGVVFDTTIVRIYWMIGLHRIAETILFFPLRFSVFSLLVIIVQHCRHYISSVQQQFSVIPALSLTCNNWPFSSVTLWRFSFNNAHNFESYCHHRWPAAGGGGVEGFNPAPPTIRIFYKAEPNSKFRGKYIRNNIMSRNMWPRGNF
jgi:hypothetical protein